MSSGIGTFYAGQVYPATFFLLLAPDEFALSVAG